MNRRAVIAGLIAFMAFAAEVSANSDSSLPKGWTAGPVTGRLGDHATIDVPVGYYLLDVAATRRLLRTSQHIADGNELGAILRAGDYGSWFAVFSYSDTGHIDDGEKDALDAAVLLSILQEGNHGVNAERAKHGRSALSLDGWHRPPVYGVSAQRLTWSTRLTAGADVTIDHAVRLLGREGVMNVRLLTDGGSALLSAAQFAEVMVGCSFNEGSRYADFRPGDRLAAYGLTALVAGGHTPVAVEGSLSPAWWIGIVLGFVVSLAGAGAWLRRRPAPLVDVPPDEPDSKSIEADSTMAW